MRGLLNLIAGRRRRAGMLAAMLATGAFVAVATPAALSASDSIVPASTAVTGSLSGSAVFSADGGAVTVTCTSSQIKGTTPSSGFSFTLSSDPTYSGCSDSAGGTDNVATAGSWTLSFTDNDSSGDQLVLGLPQDAATVTTSSGLGAGCVTTVNPPPNSTAMLPMSYDDKGDAVVDSSTAIPITISGSGCPLSGTNTTETLTATYKFSPVFCDTGDTGSSCGSTGGTVVTNTNDSGAGSLRQVIDTINASKSGGTITFDIPGSGVQTISPATPLPAITKPVKIEGFSQGGKKYTTGPPLIQIDGIIAGSGADGLELEGGKSTVQGLAIINFEGGNGIELSGAGSDTITSSYIGTDGSSGLGNGTGILIDSTANANTIGGAAKGSGNVISGNSSTGLAISTAENKIEGNLIGTNASDTTSVPNAFGVSLSAGASKNVLGGTSAADGNVISGNTNDPVAISGSSSAGANDNLIEGNRIGTNASGTSSLPNQASDAVLIGADATGNVVGGISKSDGNIIADNSGNGVHIDASTGDPILSNQIFGNTGTGIVLTNGGDNNEAPPTLTSPITQSKGKATIKGTAPAGTSIQVFSNPSCSDPEGKTLLASSTASKGTWSASVSGLSSGEGITATATDTKAHNTSPFSSCVTVS